MHVMMEKKKKIPQLEVEPIVHSLRILIGYKIRLWLYTVPFNDRKPKEKRRNI